MKINRQYRNSISHFVDTVQPTEGPAEAPTDGPTEAPTEEPTEGPSSGKFLSLDCR